MDDRTPRPVAAAGSLILRFLEKLVLAFYWPRDNWGKRAFFPPTSAVNWAIALWTLAVLVVEIVFQTWNALTWTTDTFGPSSDGIAVLLAIFALPLWGAGFIVALIALWLLKRLVSMFYWLQDTIGSGPGGG